MLGLKVGHYRIIDILGEGGMGIVYKALDVKLERFVALKILNSQALSNPQFVERFKREAKNQAKLNHPNIVPVYGFTEENNVLGIVMEYVDGITLERHIESRGKLNLHDSLHILKQILSGALYAHNKGFLHRDIKPSNIIVNNEGIAKIMDFGISKSLKETKGITRTGTKLGTILYMSPEQIKALEPTNQSDIYSIGITFYEMLSGQNPFDLGSDYRIMEAHLKMNPPRLSTMVGSVGQEVDDIIARSLNKSLKKRYASCEEFLQDINELSERTEKAAEGIPAPGKKNKNISSARGKSEDPQTKSFFARIKFFLFAFVFILMLTALVIFTYDAVSDFWVKENKLKLDPKQELDSYRLNPAYTGKSKWQTVSTNIKEQINSILFINNSLSYACGMNGAIIKSTDGGMNWFSITDSLVDFSKTNFYDAHSFSESSILFAGSEGTLVQLDIKDDTFRIIQTGTRESIFDACFLNDSQTGFLAGAGGTILITTDNGLTWSRVKSPTQKLLYKIFFLNNNKGFIAGKDGIVLSTTDGGKHWKILNKFTDEYLRSVFFLNDDIGFLAGGGGEIFRTDNGGDYWSQVKSGVFSGLSSIWFSDQNNGFILGNKGEILVTKDSGKSWEITQSGQYAGLTNLAVAPSKKIFLSGQNGLILTFSN